MTENISEATTKDRVLERLSTRRATIGVIGLGYVGLPLAFNALRRGFTVVGFDIDPEKVVALEGGRPYLPHIDHGPLAPARADGRFTPTSDYSLIAGCDAVLICVPTPLGPHREPDLSYVESTMAAALPHLQPGQILSLESSTYPGTTEELIGRPVASRGFTVGEDVFVVYSPEREDPGNARYHSHTIPKVVGGMTPACSEVGQALYAHIVEQVVPVTSTRVAEMTKLLENIYRAVNIGLVNELKLVAEGLGIDIWEVIDAAATKPFGYKPFYPGPGLGGHCIPIDPFYLTWKAKEVGINTRFIELAGEINSAMPAHVVRKTVDELNRRGTAVPAARLLVLGASYKKNVGDLRESPALEIMEDLLSRGARVDYADPFIPHVPPTRRHDLSQSAVELTPDVVSGYDGVVLATDHDAFDYEMLLAKARLIIDTRGRFRDGHSNVVSA